MGLSLPQISNTMHLAVTENVISQIRPLSFIAPLSTFDAHIHTVCAFSGGPGSATDLRLHSRIHSNPPCIVSLPFILSQHKLFQQFVLE